LAAPAPDRVSSMNVFAALYPESVDHPAALTFWEEAVTFITKDTSQVKDKIVTAHLIPALGYLFILLDIKMFGT
jgi:hypothetical protein